MARLYREAPVNSIWEGSGNVMCLDVLRAVDGDPQAAERAIAGLAAPHPGEAAVQAAARRLQEALRRPGDERQAAARHIAQDLVLLAQADLLLRHAPGDLARAFVDSRLGGHDGRVYGTQMVAPAAEAVLQRAWPE